MKRDYITFWRVVFWIIIAFGIYSTIIRFTQGLGASTALRDEFPWGLWVGFDILCGVGLAAGGFTLTAMVYIFNIERYRPIIRPTVLTAFLGYALVSFGLLYDLGKPYRIWHAILWWNPHSVMFEVAWCVMLYSTVLALEFSPVILEYFGWKKPLKLIKNITIPLVICGVILSTLHQSSLGTLFLIVPQKLHPLWYTPLMPILFFMSAIMVGLAMVIFESFLSCRAFNKKLELPLLTEIGRILLVAILVYGTVRIEDLLSRSAFSLLWNRSPESLLCMAELIIGLAFPVMLLYFDRVRRSPQGLYFSSILVILGFVMNRLNISITGMIGSSGYNYFPSWMEISITMLIIAVGFGIFSLAARYLPIYGEPLNKRVVLN